MAETTQQPRITLEEAVNIASYLIVGTVNNLALRVENAGNKPKRALLEGIINHFKEQI